MPVAGLYGLATGLAGADANDFFEGCHKDFAVADFAGARRIDDGFYDLLGNIIRDCHFDLGFRQKIDDILGSTIELCMTPLAAETLDFGDGNTLYAHVGYGLSHVIQFKWFDDGGYEFHELPLLIGT
jgi:hypothetical protein